jgi:glycerol-3-phosphate dehydrogenase (NAD(P)+)
MPEKVAVLGSGAWGTTLACILVDNGVPVTLWEHQPERALAMQHARVNAPFLPGISLPPSLDITADLGAALDEARYVLFVVPSQQMRQNARRAAPYISPAATVITGSKGLELGTLARMTEVLHAELPPGPRDRLAALSGPNLAREVAEGKPAASVVAARDHATARRVQDVFATPMLRIYTTEDVVGVEIGGALKNVIAIGIGAADGLGFGDNTKASLMTRGLAEIVRLAVAEGGNPLTLAGLAGLGDLIATCSSALSRNYSLGRELTTTGKSLQDLLAGRRTVAEGVLTARAAVQMAGRYGLPMPIAENLCRLFDGSDARALVTDLMQRDPRPERDAPHHA